MSRALLCILMACRMDGNSNSRLRDCLAALAQTADDCDNFEVLIKFDTDDSHLSQLLGILESFKDKVDIRHIITPRGAGYGDLHKAYLDLIRIAKPESAIYWVISDDIEMRTQGWDSKLLSHCNDFGDGLFTLNMQVMLDFDNMKLEDAMEGPDCYPAWSKQWIGLQGGVGYTMATDSWTSMLCHRLRTRYGVERRIFVKDLVFKRYMTPGDVAGSERWSGIRKETMNLLLSPQLTNLLDCTAQSFVHYIQHHGSYSAIPPAPHPQVIHSIRFSVLLEAVFIRLYRRLFRILGLKDF